MSKPARRLRGRAALTTLALAAGLGLIAATPASADTNTYADAVGEDSTSQRNDITSYRLTLNASALTVAFWTRGSAANPIRSDTSVIVDLDTNGDENVDFEVYRNGSGSGWDVTRGGSYSRVCSVVASPP